jgi:hypothetical protein
MAKTIYYSPTAVRTYALELYEQGLSHKHDDIIGARSEAILLMLAVDTGLKLNDLLALDFTNFNGVMLRAYKHKTKEWVEFKLSMLSRVYLEAFESWKFQMLGIESYDVFYSPVTGKPYSRAWAYKRVMRANDAGLLGKRVTRRGIAIALKATAIRNKVLQHKQDLNKVAKDLHTDKENIKRMMAIC